MTLKEPFAITYEKNGFTYVSWSQVADRLDEAVPGWSFQIIGIGEDWVHGRLTIGEQTFDNIGYAENATADWKKEVLKDAASDALKRCAAIAGVARYLYDKESPPATNGHAPVQPTRPVASAKPTVVKDDPYPDDLMETTPIAVVPVGGGLCPVHHQPWTLKPGGVSKTTGKPYSAFYACPSLDRPWCKEKPSLAWVGAQGVPA